MSGGGEQLPSITARQDVPPIDIKRIRADFPVLRRLVGGKRLTYLDNAATTQKPERVIAAVDRFYREYNANVHRGLHALSTEATTAYEAARARVQYFLNAAEAREIVFVRGATEAINLVAQSYGRTVLSPGDEILVTEMEHHANIVPWFMLCQQTGATLVVVPVDDRGELDMTAFRRRLGPRTRIVAVAHCSNALGTINPVKEITRLAHEVNAAVVVDGAQAVAHARADVADIGCDFYALSGHKMYGPTGIGALYGRAALLESMPPYQGGGEMIRSVSFEQVGYADVPYKFEAGTPDIAGAIGLAAAIDYLLDLDLDGIQQYERSLLGAAERAAAAVPGLRVIGTAREKAPILSFAMEDAHPHDIATILDSEGIAIRAGHHCAMPLMKRFGVPATVRASFAFYNTHDEVYRLFEGIEKVKEVFG